MRYRIQIPDGGGAAAVRGFIEEWVSHPALRRIVEIDGGAWPQGSLEERVAKLHDFSGRWDFRGGASERLAIGAADLQLDTDELLVRAGQLGLTDSVAPVDAGYDHGIVLGGTALANIYRVQRLFELQAGGTTMAASACLTALRELGRDECAIVESRPDIASLVEGATTEFDVMVAAVTHFGGGVAKVSRAASDNPHLASARAAIDQTLVIAAPSADPSRRANTLDNYNAYLDRVEQRQTVLVVTSSIYLPYQFFVALQALGWHRALTVEAIGFPPEWMQGVLTGATNVLQELRSALYGAHVTLQALRRGAGA
jgi:hypothetical protein